MNSMRYTLSIAHSHAHSTYINIISQTRQLFGGGKMIMSSYIFRLSSCFVSMKYFVALFSLTHNNSLSLSLCLTLFYAMQLNEFSENAFGNHFDTFSAVFMLCLYYLRFLATPSDIVCLLINWIVQG